MAIYSTNPKKSSSEPEKASKLADYLLEKQLITKTQYYAALQEQRITQEKLGIILSRGGFITKKNLLNAILEVSPEEIQGEAVFSSTVPPHVLVSNRAMIVAEADNEVFVSTLGNQLQAKVELEQYYKNKVIKFVPADFEQLNLYLDQVKDLAEDKDSLLDRLLRRAFTEGVSDIHIIPRYSSFTVFFRLLGVRKHSYEGTLDEYNTLSARIKDLARMDLAERRIPQDGGFQLEHNGKLVDLRVATVPVGSAEYIVLRLLDPDRVQPSMNGLGISRVDMWRKGVSRPDGICLICGPTGSGKTTTLNASVREMDRFESSIFTLEDPVEYRIPYVGQVNTNPALGLDFARGIRAFMRSDPDIIIVGEIRDAETARNAVKAAETGHLVLGTLHTGTIYGALQRLRDLDVPPHELVYLLRSVLVQRLMRIYCKQCHGKGCNACAGTGYGGRTIVSECNYFSSEVEVKRLLDGETWWPSMVEDAVLKYKQGLTSKEEVIRVFGEEAAVLLEKEA